MNKVAAAVRLYLKIAKDLNKFEKVLDYFLTVNVKEHVISERIISRKLSFGSDE